MRWTEEMLTLVALAIVAPVQCVSSLAGASMVSATTRSASEGSSLAMREGRVLSCRSPSTPSAAKRSCQRQTQVFDLPVSPMIAFVPSPSALSLTICALHTGFCGALRSFDQSSEPIDIGERDGKGNAGSHAADSHAASPPGISTGIQMSDFVHSVVVTI